jgi:hypothetical protein
VPPRLLVGACCALEGFRWLRCSRSCKGDAIRQRPQTTVQSLPNLMAQVREQHGTRRDVADEYCRKVLRTRKLLMGLLLFNAISSVGGGVALMTDVIPEQIQWVQHNDFPSLYFPGVILMVIVGGSAALAAVAMVKPSPGWELVSLLSGMIMVFWIIGEVASIRGFHFLQVVYLVTGVLTIWFTPCQRADGSP